jgi:hypothetical protein
MIWQVRTGLDEEALDPTDFQLNASYRRLRLELPANRWNAVLRIVPS